MASSPEFTHFACGQYIGTGSITCKKMFGEYGVYLNEKIIALICDNQFYLKKTDAGRAILGTDAQEAPPYPGANPYFLIDRLDDTEWFTGLLDSAYAELPEPKPKKSKKIFGKTDFRCLVAGRAPEYRGKTCIPVKGGGNSDARGSKGGRQPRGLATHQGDGPIGMYHAPQCPGRGHPGRPLA